MDKIKKKLTNALSAFLGFVRGEDKDKFVSPIPLTTPKLIQTPTITPTPTPPTDWESLKPLFAKEARKAGFLPSVIVSQAALESGRGQSEFARKRNNYFGLGAYTENPNNAFSFDHPLDSLKYYIKTISTDPRYKKAYQVRNDARRYLEELVKAGYATDPNYVEKVLNTPEFRMYNY